ncbi:MAG: FtsW/RodA/SpoVE family cell cycle protein [Anaerolineales bacterium]|nr:FtsW/RodA/SpoVE family cell cycle protein [Anaerolineales bacterium]
MTPSERFLSWSPDWSIPRLESRLLILSAAFLFIYALTLSLSPAARLRDWSAPLLWSHWLGYAAWLLSFLILHLRLSRRLENRDPYLLPIAGTLVGWGLLTIWRVAPVFGARQTIWLALAVVLTLLLLRLPRDLGYLRQYKYLWLTGGLILTALTLILGTNPTGFGPRLWLGCCGVYFQPSEPLKLLLVIYLAAYLADRQLLVPRLLPLLAPTLLLIGLAIGLMLAQRDLGTASIFLILFVTVIYFATGRHRFLLVGAGILILAGAAGYLLYDVIRIRVDAWINPWADPIGRSYQIVQSLLAVAAGGMLGRGPGLGSPTFVPVQHSDFIFASIAEETGLVGTIALLVLLAGFTVRGLRVALNAPGKFRRYLAVGLVVYIGAQSILIIGGNLRLLPLTGVTLPFVSYGGSSLFTSMLALLFLIKISAVEGQEPAPVLSPRQVQVVGALLLAGLAALAVVNGWWAFYRGPDLLLRTDNPRRALSDLYVQRGAILDREGVLLAESEGRPGEYRRSYLIPEIGSVIGYVHPLYGQAGIEDAQDAYLRGLEGTLPMDIWWNHILYGQPPEGLDVRQTLDAELQELINRRLAGRSGALIMVNSSSGEIFGLSSQPSFDPNTLEDDWEMLIERDDAPFLNRASQGQYPAGAALGPLLFAAAIEQSVLPTYSPDAATGCKAGESAANWPEAIRAGCEGAIEILRLALGPAEEFSLYTSLGFYEAPRLRMPAASTPILGQSELSDITLVSPLQMSLAMAALNSEGVKPAPRIATSIKSAEGVWSSLAPLDVDREAFNQETASDVLGLLALPELPIWETVALASTADGDPITWYLAGTGPSRQGTPLTLVLVLEEDDPQSALEIGREVLLHALQ